jgi:hypothetical protein
LEVTETGTTSSTSSKHLRWICWCFSRSQNFTF